MLERLTVSQRAALDLSRSLAVVAGAGCGKTQVLAARYLAALGSGVRPDEILALTFTERAALEMKARIRSWLREQGQELEHPRIGTIHAFAAGLLREHAVAAGVDPGFAILDGVDRIVLVRDAVAELCDRLARGRGSPDDGEALGVLARSFVRPALEAVLRGLLARRDRAAAWAAATAEITDLELLARWRRIPLGSALLKRRLGEPALARALAELAGARPRSRRAAEVTEQVVRAAAACDRPEAAHAFVEALYRQDDRPRSLPEGAPPALEWLQQVLALEVAELRAEIGGSDELAAPAVRALARLLRAALAAYDAAKSARQALDFDDLGLHAEALLASHSEVCARVRRQYRSVLIDEAQDLSPSQWALLSRICGDPGQGGGLREAVLFAVGDEKQSIYRFRGADVSLWSEIRAAVARANASGTQGIVTLQDNFRSHREVLGFVNQLFARLLANPTQPYQAAAQALEAAREPSPEGGAASPRPGVDLLLDVDEVPASESGDGDAEALRLHAEADRVARYLASTHWRGAGGCKLGDCAILLPWRTHLAAFEDALRRHGVPFIVLGGLGFYQTQEVRDAHCLLQFLCDPRRDIELCGVLRSPFCALPDALVYAIARTGRGSLWQRLHAAAGEGGLRAGEGDLIAAASASERAQIRRAFARLSRWRARAGHCGAAELYAQALDDSGAYAALAQGLRGPQQLANVARLCEVIRGFEVAGWRGLWEAAEALGVLIEEEEQTGEARVPDDADDAVRILTIHAAKGLEFPLCVVPELGMRFPEVPDRLRMEELSALGGACEVALPVRDPQTGKRKRPGLYVALGAEARRKSDAEMKRLLYVACTRARERLVLSGSVTRARDGRALVPSRSWLSWIQGALGLRLSPIAEGTYALGGAEYEVLTGRALQPAAPARPGPEVAALGEAELSAAIAAAQPGPERGARLRLTPALACALESCPHKLRLRLLSGRAEFAPEPDSEALWEGEDDAPPRLATAVARGLLLHRAFELEAFAAPDPRALVFRLAAQARLSDRSVVETVCAQVAAFARSPFCLRIASARPAYAELPFLLTTAGVELSGTIDRLVREPDGTWRVIDWKTDEVAAERAAEHARAHGYFTQLRLYAQAAQAIVGADAPVRATLYFTYPGVAVEVPEGPSPLSALPLARLLGGDLPPSDPATCGACGYHARGLCDVDPLRARPAAVGGSDGDG
jgi:ATP-dependent helicase/nuclease subunit A